MNNKLILGGVVVAVAVVAVYASLSFLNKGETPGTPVDNLTLTTPLPDASGNAGLNTYRNEEYQFTFAYPKELTLAVEEQPSKAATRFEVWLQQSPNDSLRIIAFTIAFFPQGVRNAGDYKIKTLAKCDGISRWNGIEGMLCTYSETMIGGLPALVIDETGGGGSFRSYTLVGQEYLYSFQANRFPIFDEQVLEQVAKSFQLIIPPVPPASSGTADWLTYKDAQFEVKYPPILKKTGTPCGETSPLFTPTSVREFQGQQEFRTNDFLVDMCVIEGNYEATAAFYVESVPVTVGGRRGFKMPAAAEGDGAIVYLLEHGGDRMILARLQLYMRDRMLPGQTPAPEQDRLLKQMLTTLKVF